MLDGSPGSKTLLPGGRLEGGETSTVDRDMQDAVLNRPMVQSCSTYGDISTLRPEGLT